MAGFLVRPSKPLTSDLRKIFGQINPRTLKAFEQLFEAVPGDFNEIISEINALDIRVAQNEADIDALEDFVFKVIQFKSADYSILVSDSGVIVDSSAVIDMPAGSTWVDQNKFIENAGASTVSIELFGDEQVSGVDVLFLLPDTLNPVVNLKSNGPGLTLLSDRDNENIVPAVYWETQLGEQMETKLGEKLAFRV